VTFDLNGGPFSATPDAPDEPQDDVDVVAPGLDTIDLEGDSGNDVLSGNGGGSTGGPAIAQYFGFYGQGGDDELTGSTDATTPYNFYEPGSGDDDINAAAGAYDEISFGTSPNGVQVDLANGTATGEGTDSFTPNAMYYAFGSAFDDTLLGGSSDEGLNGSYGDDVIDGRGGQDQVYGDAGNDTIDGGDSSDNLFPGAGGDVIHGGAGKDVVFFGVGGNAASGVTVDVPNGVVTGEGADTIQSDIEAYVGTSLSDTFLGTEDHDEFYGSNGNDKLYGKGGADYLSGGLDSDTLSGGRGSPDTCYQNGGKGSTSGCEIKA
jgi:Ca2+-binding RTX toxin-like protein